MGSALIIHANPGLGYGSNSFISLGGTGSLNTTAEDRLQLYCTEAATFSNLRARIHAGNSGTATLVTRNNGSTVNQSVAIAGTDVGEDTSNSDTVSAADLFNYLVTLTGSQAQYSWITSIVSFSSGHGNFHQASQGVGNVYDISNGTTYLQLCGNCFNDGATTEADAAWRVRGYDTFEAIQVYVQANARTNDSTVTNRIAAAAGTGSITIGSGATGMFTDTGLSDSISDGEACCLELALGANANDLTLSSFGGTFKSSSSKSDVFGGVPQGLSRAASATEHYVPIGGRTPGTLTTLTESEARIKPGFEATVSNVRIYCTANTYGGDGTLKLYKNGTAVITTTITSSGGAAWYENTSDTTTITDTDELSFGLDEGTSGSITFTLLGLTFAPTGGAVAYVMFPPRLDGIGHGGIFPGNRVQ